MSEQRPSFLTAEWRHLLMLNYEIDPAILATRIPAGTELDFWNGRTYVSVVGFRFLNTRLRGFSIPLHTDFSEVNLRFYVRRKVGTEWRRGVAFVKEIVPLPAVSLVARWVYNENYVTLPMRQQLTPSRCSQHAAGLLLPNPSSAADRPAVPVPGTEPSQQSALVYAWKYRGRWNELAADFVSRSEPVLPDSEEEFITEHYWGYTAQRNGSSMEYAVEHPAWRIFRTITCRLDCDIAPLYGAEFTSALSGAPRSSFVAEGSEIVVRQGQSIRSHPTSRVISSSRY